jgi:hypothetical protein
MKRLHGGAGDPSILDFSENVNSLGPPAEVLAVLSDAGSHVRRYPSADAAAARGGGPPLRPWVRPHPRRKRASELSI